MSLEDFNDIDLTEPLEPTIKNIIEDKGLQWIFVGGKGGVGKTTISSCIAVQLAKVRESVLIISTDPAHNLSDAFSQKFSPTPTKVKGFDNLYAMEIDPHFETEEVFGDFVSQNSTLKNLMKELGNSMPGMDEISSFLEIMKQVKSMKFSVIVFDTAPTGHTLRLLSFPSMLDKNVGKLLKMQNMNSLVSQMTSMLGGNTSTEKLQEQINSTKEMIETVAKTFKDPEKCTFVCVCIPEFLSVYETERLVQELTKFEIDTHNIVVNQIVFPPENSSCGICKARSKIQQKYLNQIFDLYGEDFHIVQMPLLGEEVRGVESLEQFGKNLLKPYPETWKEEQQKMKEKGEKPTC